MSAPPDVFPYAENYDPSAQGQWSLEGAQIMCGFEELHETNSEKGKMATRPLPEGFGIGQLDTIGF